MALLAVVTGAARRVGRASAVALAARGVNLVLTRNSGAAELEQAASECHAAARAAGHAIQVQQQALDMEDSEAVEGFAHSVRGPVDVLVLNAARYEPDDMGHVTPVQLHRDYQVNAVAPLLLLQGLAEHLRQSTLEGGASVVAMGDMHAAGRPVGSFTSYLMSKAALHLMVQQMAVALAPAVRVNGILPGVVAWPEGTDAGVRERYEGRIPLSRPGTPQDAAAAVCALCFELRYVTGELLRLDGGRWLR